MRIRILGSGAAYPRPGGACSGFLVQTTDVTVWLDAGNGSFSRLTQHVDHIDIDAVVISHSHADHISDLLPLMYARGFDERVDAPIPVYAPPDVAPVVSAPLGHGSIDAFQRVFDFRPIASVEIGDLRFEPFRTVHPVETYGFRVIDGDRSLVYTADTADFPDLPGACSGTNLLLCEATFVGDTEAPPGLHLWAREAGAIALKAQAERLMLTHIWPTHEPQEAVEEATQVFEGETAAAIEGDLHEV